MLSLARTVQALMPASSRSIRLSDSLGYQLRFTLRRTELAAPKRTHAAMCRAHLHDCDGLELPGGGSMGVKALELHHAVKWVEWHQSSAGRQGGWWHRHRPERLDVRRNL